MLKYTGAEKIPREKYSSIYLRGRFPHKTVQNVMRPDLPMATNGPSSNLHFFCRII